MDPQQFAPLVCHSSLAPQESPPLLWPEASASAAGHRSEGANVTMLETVDLEQASTCRCAA